MRMEADNTDRNANRYSHICDDLEAPAPCIDAVYADRNDSGGGKRGYG